MAEGWRRQRPARPLDLLPAVGRRAGLPRRPGAGAARRRRRVAVTVARPARARRCPPRCCVVERGGPPHGVRRVGPGVRPAPARRRTSATRRVTSTCGRRRAARGGAGRRAPRRHRRRASAAAAPTTAGPGCSPRSASAGAPTAWPGAAWPWPSIADDGAAAAWRRRGTGCAGVEIVARHRRRRAAARASTAPAPSFAAAEGRHAGAGPAARGRARAASPRSRGASCRRPTDLLSGDAAAARPRARRRRRRGPRLRPAAARRPAGSAASARCSTRSGFGAGSAPRDLVVTGEGGSTGRRLRGKVVAAVAAAGARRPPCRAVVVAGQVLVGPARGAGPRASSGPTPSADARPSRSPPRWPTPAGTLAARAARVAAPGHPRRRRHAVRCERCAGTHPGATPWVGTVSTAHRLRPRRITS